MKKLVSLLRRALASLVTQSPSGAFVVLYLSLMTHVRIYTCTQMCAVLLFELSAVYMM